MKTLILVRHAKSDWSHEGLSDLERPLNDRGKRDAPEMAKRLKEKISSIDLFLSSTAKRAKKTAKYFMEEYGVDKDKLQVDARLYEDVTAAYDAVLISLENKYDTVALFAHSPTIGNYANAMTNVHTDNIPTCGMFAVQADAATWGEFIKSEKAFLFYDYPKNPLTDL